MRDALSFILLAGFLLVSILPLVAQNNINLIQSFDTGDKRFGRTFQLDETHYLTVWANTVRIYQVLNDQISVVNEVVVKDRLIPNSEMIGNRIYAVAEGDGVYVYQITPDYQIMFERIIPLNALGDEYHYSLYVLGSKMIVLSMLYMGPGTEYQETYIDAYDIANPDQPVHLSHLVFQDQDALFGAVQVPGGYYLSTFLGLGYYSADLISFSAPFLLPGLNFEQERIETSFVHDGKIYFKGIGTDRSCLWRCSVNNDHSLSLDWVQTMQGYWFCGIRFEPDRVVMMTADPGGGSHAITYSINGENWQQTACLDIPLTYWFFPVSNGYLGFQNEALRRYNSSFSSVDNLYSSTNWQIADVVMNRYLVLESYYDPIVKFFDLEAGAWLDQTSSFNLNLYTSRWNKTEIILGDGDSCHLICFDDSGIASESSFSLNLEYPYLSCTESKWGNRILSLVAYRPICEIRLFDYDNEVVTPLNTWTFDYYCPNVEFYAPNHFYTVQRELANQFMHFYRINPDYSITRAASIPVNEPYRIYQGDGFIATSGIENNLIDIQDPDQPFLASMFPLGGYAQKNISYNGDGHFLYTGINMLAKAQVVDTQGEVVTSFYAHLPWSIGGNRFVTYNSTHFCIMEHPGWLENEDEYLVPAVSNLGLPYPNPFRDICNVPVLMKEPGELKLSVFNLRGQLVNDIENTNLDKGEHTIVWDGKDRNGNTLANGVYILRLQTREGVFSQKTVLLK
ncbi:MAG TPA: FlgD immunoglobulin-like domain containing protein [Candidatus Cloacimonadota bacterium]|nr:FlgD immunoglobulin-like domain containing protein [Candidatus Cloacimonadota bacterium]